jgi:CubicO group peptidase (beta-lactamase class C family)
VLLGLIIERTTGQLLADELRERIFVPAGLRATSFDTEPRIAGRHAHGYERLGNKQRMTDVTAVDPTFTWAAGAIVSTASDVARFYNKLYGGHLLRPDLLAAMQTTGPMAAELKGWGYGFGLIKKPIGCRPGIHCLRLQQQGRQPPIRAAHQRRRHHHGPRGQRGAPARPRQRVLHRSEGSPVTPSHPRPAATQADGFERRGEAPQGELSRPFPDRPDAETVS